VGMKHPSTRNRYLQEFLTVRPFSAKSRRTAKRIFSRRGRRHTRQHISAGMVDLEEANDHPRPRFKWSNEPTPSVGPRPTMADFVRRVLQRA